MIPTGDPFLDFLLTNTNSVSARFIHRQLEIRQPYPLWISRRVIKNACYRQPDDYVFVLTDEGRDCELSPVCAIDAAAGGGSRRAAMLQVRYCSLLAGHVFAGRDVMEVFDTAQKAIKADRFLERALDPEP